MGLTEEEATAAAGKVQAIQRGKLARRQLAADKAAAAVDAEGAAEEVRARHPFPLLDEMKCWMSPHIITPLDEKLDESTHHHPHAG
jgi:hypothetical protein